MEKHHHTFHHLHDGDDHAFSMHQLIMEGGTDGIPALDFAGSTGFPMLQHQPPRYQHQSSSISTGLPRSSQLPPPPQLMQYPVRVRILRLQLLVVTLAVIGVIAVAMWLCANAGIRLETFVATDKDDAARKKLLDKYNSYSGNLVSVLTKPFELFFAMTIAIGLLCFATKFTLSAHTTRYHQMLLVVGALAGYLLSNGFNAINVQLSPGPVHLVITAGDLSKSAARNAMSLEDFAPVDGLDRMQQMANLTSDKKLLEETSRNAITNTALRNRVLFPELTPNANCSGRTRDYARSPQWDGVTPTYGFPQGSWQSGMLREAVEPTRALKLVVESGAGSSSSSSKDGIRVASSRGLDAARMELPMSVSRAMGLMVHAIYASEQIVFSDFQAYTSVLKKIAEDAIKHDVVSGKKLNKLPTLNELLFKELVPGYQGTSDSVSDREAVETIANLTRRTFSTLEVTNASPNDVELEFTHLDLTDELTFDALTIEFPAHSGFLHRRLVIDDSNLQGYSVLNESDSSSAGDGDTGDQYYELDVIDSCSLSACALYEPNRRDFNTQDFLVESQVLAIRVCVDEQSQEALTVSFTADPWVVSDVECANTSSSSMYTISVGKRIEGEEISYSTIAGQGAWEYKTREIVRLKNARKVFSVTAGQLSWETRDLAELYGAECVAEDKNMCQGLRYELDTSEPKQHLVVGSKRLPLRLVPEFTYREPPQMQFLSLFLVKLPETETSSGFISKEDLVLPRRFNKSSLTRSYKVNNSIECSADVEDFAFHMEMNHLFIEKSLQPSYTAAVFFLFQDGVVRDVVESGGVTADALKTSVALAFLNNTQLMEVRLSSPWTNIVLTLVGAAILLSIAIAIVVSSNDRERTLERLVDAHNVAEMLIDNTKFPSLLLEKSVLGVRVAEQQLQPRRQDQRRKKERPPFNLEASMPLNETMRIRSVVLGSSLEDGQLAIHLAPVMDSTHRASVL